MKEGNLRQIINALYDMELNDYFVFATIQRLQESIFRLGRKNRFRVPEKTEVAFNFLYLAILGVAGTVIGFATGFFSLGVAYVFIFALYGLIIGSVWGFILAAVPYIKETRKTKKNMTKKRKSTICWSDRTTSELSSNLKFKNSYRTRKARLCAA